MQGKAHFGCCGRQPQPLASAGGAVPLPSKCSRKCSPSAAFPQSKCSLFAVDMQSSYRASPYFVLSMRLRVRSILYVWCVLQFRSVLLSGSMPWHGSATRDLGTPLPVCVVVVLLACPTRHWHRWRLLLEMLTIAESLPGLTGCAREARYQTPIGGQGRTALHGSNKSMGQNGLSLLAVITKTTT